MGKTIVEKIFSTKAQQSVFAGDIIMASVDVIMMNDASGPLAIDFFRKMGVNRVSHPERVVTIIDHYVPCPNKKVSELQQMLFDFSKEYGTKIISAGQGIAHQVLDELNLVSPGSLIVGCDSHTTTHGFVGSLGIGIGASDLASSLIDGELWFKVPETIKINLKGKKRSSVSGKDIALFLLKILGGDGANYKALEFSGSGLPTLSIEDRKTICNLAAECCAKCAIFDVDEIALNYLRNKLEVESVIRADKDAKYCREINLNLSDIHPMISLPSTADNSCPVRTKRGMKIDMALIGTCTNGRIGDFETVDRIVSKAKEKFKVETIVIPSSAIVYSQMIEKGYAKNLVDKGAMILPPGCGPCCGSSPGTPRDNFKVISTANRNFIGRMGNVTSEIYLASPATVALSALEGMIVDPEEYYV